MRRLAVASLALVWLAAGCAWIGAPRGGREASVRGGRSIPIRHWPDRRDYVTFREAHPEILEPNYLPFMVHRVAGDGPAGDLLFFCRWPAGQMPLAVFVELPTIPESLQDEVHPTEPRYFAAGVEHALRVWERELEGLVTFRLVPAAQEAKLRIRLLGRRAPARCRRGNRCPTNRSTGAAVGRGI